jgi:hypothetical protein
MFNYSQAPISNNSRYVQKGKKVNEVYRTDDLSIFKSIDGNRVPNLQHVNRLADSIRVYGMKCNPILVNENMEVIDGQHRLMASKQAESFVYYIIVEGYSLNEVHTLNLNQKNWSKKDFMQGYASMGIKPYIKLKDFVELNPDFTFNDCISLCSNRSGDHANQLTKYTNSESSSTPAQIFQEGTWKGRSFDLAQQWADKLRMIKPFYLGYNRSSFVGTMTGLFQNKQFDFKEFMHKLKLQPTSLVDCASRDQYKTLIENIYNWKSREKTNLRF